MSGYLKLIARDNAGTCLPLVLYSVDHLTIYQTKKTGNTSSSTNPIRTLTPTLTQPLCISVLSHRFIKPNKKPLNTRKECDSLNNQLRNLQSICFCINTSRNPIPPRLFSFSSMTFIPPKATLRPTSFKVSIPDTMLEEMKQLIKASKIASETYESSFSDRKYGVTREWITNAKEQWENHFDWYA